MNTTNVLTSCIQTTVFGLPITMLKHLRWTVLYAACFLSPLVHSTPVNVVDLGYASYKGNLSYPDVVAYLGLPYAEPPLDERRFRASLPLNISRISEQTHGGVVDATEYPEFCVQGSTGGMCELV